MCPLSSSAEYPPHHSDRLAILGLTYQYITSRISRETYDKYHAIFYDEVCRLNPSALTTNNHTFSLNPDDLSIRTTEELRFVLYRHWNLYDAMYHSSYVAGKLGIWKERGRRKLNGLLAKIGWVLHNTLPLSTHPAIQILSPTNTTGVYTHGPRPKEATCYETE